MKEEKWLKLITESLERLGYETDRVKASLKLLSDEADQGQRPLLTAKQLCRLLGISRTTLWRMQLPCVVVGRRKRYALDAVMAVLETNNNGCQSASGKREDSHER